MPESRKLKTLDDVPMDGKKVIVRVDFNIPVGDDHKVDECEDYRIETALDTINELRQRRAKILLLTHLGRPQEEGGDSNLDPIRFRLEELLGEEIKMAKRLFGTNVATIADSLEPGGIVLLPNVRLDAREEMNNQNFADDLASSAEAYVNEAFSVSHRAHTSVSLLPQLLPSAAGRRTVLEVEVLTKLREAPEHPYVAIASGAKITTKVGMLRDLLSKVDTLCIAGQLGNVFLAAQGKFPEEHFNADDIAVAKNLLEIGGSKLVIPVDVVIGNPDGTGRTLVEASAIPAPAEGLWDIGPKSITQILDTCAKAKTIMWNGPVGRFEVPAYAEATITLAKELAKLSAYRVVGGGDTVHAIEQEHLTTKYNHVSIGGGAMIEFLEGKRMPGLEPLYK